MKITIKINTDHDAFFSANPNYELDPHAMLDAMDSAKKAVMGLINNEQKHVNNIDIDGKYLDTDALGSIEIKCDKVVKPKKYCRHLHKSLLGSK